MHPPHPLCLQHVPGFVSWPASITTNRHTSLPVSTNDYMPTVLEAWGVAHPQPTWASDGQSIMPLLQGASVSSRSPFGFQLGQQVAYMDGEHMKLVVRPEKGQCKTLLPPYDKKHLDGPFLFNITAGEWGAGRLGVTGWHHEPGVTVSRDVWWGQTPPSPTICQQKCPTLPPS